MVCSALSACGARGAHRARVGARPGRRALRRAAGAGAGAAGARARRGPPARDQTPNAWRARQWVQAGGCRVRVKNGAQPAGTATLWDRDGSVESRKRCGSLAGPRPRPSPAAPRAGGRVRPGRHGNGRRGGVRQGGSKRGPRGRLRARLAGPLCGGLPHCLAAGEARRRGGPEQAGPGQPPARAACARARRGIKTRRAAPRCPLRGWRGLASRQGMVVGAD
jgi:hypothetical protein